MHKNPSRGVISRTLLRHSGGFAVLLQLVLGMAASAASPVQVETMYYRGKTPQGQAVDEKGIAMPRVRMSDAAVAAKINDRLFIEVMSALAPRRQERYFTVADGVDIGGTASQSFSVVRNDGRILAIDLDAEGCGAYCEGYIRSYAFDVSSGRYLNPQDLFTTNGMRELSSRMMAERKSRYRREIANVRRELRAEPKRGAKATQETSNLDERLELNQGCIKTLDEDAALKTDQQVFSRIDSLRLSVGAHTFDLTAERCSNHASRAIDDVGEVTLKLAYPALRPHLTPYGRWLLLNEQRAAPPESVYGQILRGRLGADVPITMLLRHYPDGGVGGVYFYDRVRKAIQLTGRASGNAIELTEEEVGRPKAKLALTVKPGGLGGSWEGARKYSIELTP